MKETVALQKPTLESIKPSFGHSFTCTWFDADHQNNNQTWHYHPEIELVYVNGGTGKRLIGSHVSYYQKGDLLLIGSNLPHCGFTEKLSGRHTETVIQMKPDFLGDEFLQVPEMREIQILFERARGGMAFSGNTKKEVGNQLRQLKEQDEFDQLLTILSVLNRLGTSKEFKILNANGLSLEAIGRDNERIERVFNYVRTHFKEHISLDEIADLISMTPPSFCRFFKKTTNKTFVQFVNEIRLVHASKLLAEHHLGITDICFECGFNNFSHFNKSFKKFTGQTPSAYRDELKTIIQ
ncbi:AraC family transcriptional regulator [Croceiramulus getboli]|nr:AraC family transcriptional regulator [Flavobacteriaceae bacterium YJPT1-3]